MTVLAWIASNALALFLALVLDALFGEPDWLWKRVPHPVVLLGRFIGWQDRRLNLESKPDWRRRQAGIVMLIRLLFIVAFFTVLPLMGLWSLHPVLAVLFQVVVGAVFLAQRSLYDHVAAVAAPLATDDLPAARTALSMIVGRRTDDLDEEAISRAALESLAENHADGVVAPAFWFLLGGAPGIALYKAINTADSMVGYKTERHRAFGWASARLDDAVNLAPARLSVGLVALGVLAAKLLRYPVVLCYPKYALIGVDARTHASPNAGWPEAAYASALGIALGGPRTYRDHTVDAPFINAGGRRALSARDIRAGLSLFHATCGATGVVVLIIAMLGL